MENTESVFMNAYKRINNLTGWLVFGIAATVYLYTMEPTVSLWDSGEFITAAAKLEVGHPPGAPFYLMLARVFSLFAADKSNIAMCINSLSALASAFTVMFLFWTITHLVRRTILKNKEVFTRSGLFMIIGSGLIGAVSFSFTDSFWFSATEAEVYALSSLFTAVVFWSILKWEEEHGPYSNRWLVLIAYLMGLSIGVHLLNLLVIPAIIMIIYFRKYRFKWWTFLSALLISFLILLSLLYIFIPGMVKLAAITEKILINDFQWPVNSGIAIFAISITLVLILLSYITYSKKLINLNIALLFITFFLIGFSSYAFIVIRAQANPFLNTGNPSNVYSLLSYLKRDQYANTPLFYGKYYNAPVKSIASSKYIYLSRDKLYKTEYVNNHIKYDPEYMTLFPRMYSSHPNHIEVYRNWATIRDTPRFLDNLEFFVKYQVGYMYLRYFLWNFSGKQNDMQGNGGIMKGNWISGFDFIDQWFIGPQKQLPEYLKNNPGRNRYYLLPFLLGICGMVWHYKRSRRYFSAVFLLFLLTSLGIIIYTNQTPLQPRERDYVYVGSFYVFSIWIGFGFLSVVKRLQKLLPSTIGLVVGSGLALIIPGLLFSQNTDDHNRNGRYMIKDIAYNYLSSCEPNAILFTAGDNDTYPLWYLQQVENVRTDVRVINLMLLNTSWYIEQQKMRQGNAGRIPLKLDYLSSLRTVYVNYSDSTYDLQDVLHQLKNEMSITNANAKLYIPAYIRMTKTTSTDTSNNKYKTSVETHDPCVCGEMWCLTFKLTSSYLRKNEIALLDIFASLDPGRPVYFVEKGIRENLGLEAFLKPDGFIFKLTNKDISTGESYQKLMQKTSWQEWSDGKGLMDDHVRNMLSIMDIRQNYARLGISLAEEGKLRKSEEVLDYVMRIMPPEKIPYDRNCIAVAEGYFKAGKDGKAIRILSEFNEQLKQEKQFYRSLKPWMRNWVEREWSITDKNMSNVAELLKKYKKDN